MKIVTVGRDGIPDNEIELQNGLWTAEVQCGAGYHVQGGWIYNLSYKSWVEEAVVYGVGPNDVQMHLVESSEKAFPWPRRWRKWVVTAKQPFVIVSRSNFDDPNKWGHRKLTPARQIHKGELGRYIPSWRPLPTSDLSCQLVFGDGSKRVWTSLSALTKAVGITPTEAVSGFMPFSPENIYALNLPTRMNGKDVIVYRDEPSADDRWVEKHLGWERISFATLLQRDGWENLEIPISYARDVAQLVTYGYMLDEQKVVRRVPICHPKFPVMPSQQEARLL